jgi:hypothetical protein
MDHRVSMKVSYFPFGRRAIVSSASNVKSSGSVDQGDSCCPKVMSADSMARTGA